MPGPCALWNSVAAGRKSRSQQMHYSILQCLQCILLFSPLLFPTVFILDSPTEHHTMKAYGWLEVQPQTFSTAALNAGKFSPLATRSSSPSGKEPLMTIGLEAWWALQPFWTMRRREELVVPPWNRTPAALLLAHLYNDCSIAPLQECRQFMNDVIVPLNCHYSPVWVLPSSILHFACLRAWMALPKS
jgi:hypothetical protein